jgi:Mn2+/Fe2+ NRAMP family transporter
MINWGALGAVSRVSLAAGVVIVVLVALALVGLSAREPAADTEAADTADGTEPVGRATGPVMSAAAGTALAAVCLLAVAAIVVYGLALVIFHH